ncbi:MAG: hypothetical protein JW876_07140 [Candidatus Krumholzibacteriota bacterium]|nr:hypothetical protein [Candidatus Krumholzibacteriota bacterium]
MRILRHARGAAIGAALAIAACAPFASRPTPPPPFLSYAVRLADGQLGVVEVAGSVSGVTVPAVRLSTAEREGGRAPEPIGFRATGPGGGTLAVEADGEGWTVRCGRRDFTFSYRLVLTIEDRYTADVRTMLTSLDEDRCRLHGGDLLLVPLMETAPGVIVDVDLFPGAPVSAPWDVVGRRILAPGVGEAVGMVVAAGAYRFFENESAGTTVGLAIAGDWKFEDGEFFDLVGHIVRREISWFGDSPVDRYLFVCDRNPARGGKCFDHYGMHTGSSMILLLDPALDRSLLFDTPMSIVAHEFFHNWNGGAIPPGEIWFVEGATVYFSFQALLDTRTIVPAQYRRKRDAIAARFAENPYAGRVPVADAGIGDLGDRDMVNLLYDGGFLAAEAVDARLREATGGRVGLIDVMRRMYETGARADGEALDRAAVEVCGEQLAPLVDALVRDPASARLLAGHGTS